MAFHSRNLPASLRMTLARRRIIDPAADEVPAGAAPPAAVATGSAWASTARQARAGSANGEAAASSGLGAEFHIAGVSDRWAF